MPKQLFGTDGIRGVPGSYPLDDVTIYGVALALAKYLRVREAHPRVLIGMDTRESGPRIASLLAAGLTDEGVTCLSAGIITTPGVACLVRLEQLSAGIVISASHNPYTDNGIKLFAATGMKFPDEVEEHLEVDIEEHKDQEPLPHGTDLTADDSLDRDYLKYLQRCAIPGANLTGMKMVLDCANGAASGLGPELFRSLGAEVIAIHDQPNGRNINDACGSLHPEGLREKVQQTRASLGVAFDGDADRAMFISATGRIVDGDGVLLAAARYLKSTGKLKGNVIVGTIMANLGLERALAEEGLRLTREPVGDRYVLEAMLRSGANLGGEQSGHIIFLDDATTGDGLLTALKTACLVTLAGPLDNLVRGLKIYPQTIVNVVVKSKPPLQSIPSVAAAIESAERTLGSLGRIVVRYSGTEPKARVMVEAESLDDVHRWANTVAAAIRDSIGT